MTSITILLLSSIELAGVVFGCGLIMAPSSNVLPLCRRLFPDYGLHIISPKRFNLMLHGAGETISCEQMLDNTWKFEVVSAGGKFQYHEGEWMKVRGESTLNSNLQKQIEQLAEALSGRVAA